MNITIPLLKGAADAAAIPGDSVTSLLKMMGDSAGLFADNSPDGWLGMLMSGLSGVATALAVAIMLTLPGKAQCRFKLRLAASPTHSDQFGPWHLADRVASPLKGEETRTEQNDAFQIRYRVL